MRRFRSSQHRTAAPRAGDASGLAVVLANAGTHATHSVIPTSLHAKHLRVTSTQCTLVLPWHFPQTTRKMEKTETKM